ncbi:PcfJ domain-containing protein [Alienimonas sp. DA493]|uniref:PcfJ domain-containing protein n=1 Tax=Alienimonas sp. DA493 TaxID=3373605 RepID=UPI003754D67E
MASARTLRKASKHERSAAERAARFAPAPDAGFAPNRGALRPKLGRVGVWEADRNAGRAAADLAARRTLWELFAPPPPPLVPVSVRPAGAVEAEERPSEPVDRLLARLRGHAAILDDPAALAAAVTAALGVPGGPSADANCRAVHALCGAAGGALDPAALLCFAPFWVREPAAFVPPPADVPVEPRDLGPAVVAHLFGRYPIPAVLAPAFARSPLEEPGGAKWLRWAVALGAGAGLRAAGRALGPTYGWDAPGRFQFLFEQESREQEGARLGRCPGGPLAAAIRAEVRRTVGDDPARCDRIAQRLLSLRFYRLDPTALPRDARAAARRAFWAATVGWLATHGAALSDPDARDVLAWAAERFEACGFGGPTGFVWRRRSAAGALAAVREAAARAAAAEAERLAAERRAREAARDAARRLARRRREETRQAEARRERVRRSAPPSLRWEPRGWDWEWKSRGSWWVITELTSSEALFEEGREMKHCAAGYASLCRAGQSAVFGVTLNGKRRLTVEVEPGTGKLVQVRGPGNRGPTPEEAAVISKWRRRQLRRRAIRRHG